MISGIIVQIVVVCLISFGIGTLMEWYKKKLRGDKASIWEIRGIALGLSLVVSVLLNISGIAYPVFATVFKSMSPGLAKILNIVLYAVVIFILQLQSDMKLLKGLLKLVANKVSFQDIVELLEKLNKTTGIKPNTIANIMLWVGLTEEKCIEALVAAGIPKDDAVKIMVDVMTALNPNKTVEETTAQVIKTYEETKS